MYFYISIFLLCAAFIFNNKSFSFVRGYLVSLALMLLFLLMGTRLESIGTDTSAYYRIFDQIADADEFSVFRYEPGFLLIARFLSDFGFGPEALIVVCSLIIISALTFFIIKTSTSVSLSCILYIGVAGYFFAFNGVRQAMAEVMILLAFMYFFLHSYKKSLIFFFLAPMFHFVSLVTVPMVLVFKIPKKYSIFLLPIIYFISLLFLLSPAFFQSVFFLALDFMPTIYSSYIENPSFEGSSGFLTIFYQCVFILCFFAFYLSENEVWQRYFLMTMIGVILINIFTYSGFLNRIPRYWMIFLIVAIPLAIDVLFCKYQRLLVSFSVFLVSTLFFLRAIEVSSNNVFPYYSWFF